MKVWTLITRETLRLLQEGIPYYGDKKDMPVVDFPYTPGGYSLLVNKMIQQLGFRQILPLRLFGDIIFMAAKTIS